MPAWATSLWTGSSRQRPPPTRARRTNRAIHVRFRNARSARRALRSAARTASAPRSVLRATDARTAAMSASSRPPSRGIRSRRASPRAERVRLPQAPHPRRTARPSTVAAISWRPRCPERSVAHATRSRPRASRTAATEVGGAIRIVANAKSRRRPAHEPPRRLRYCFAFLAADASPAPSGVLPMK
jgi:hypothetical protein